MVRIRIPDGEYIQSDMVDGTNVKVHLVLGAKNISTTGEGLQAVGVFGRLKSSKARCQLGFGLSKTLRGHLKYFVPVSCFNVYLR